MIDKVIEEVPTKGEEKKKRKPEIVDLYWHDIAIESAKLGTMKRF
jgi:hypothetical protein